MWHLSSDGQELGTDGRNSGRREMEPGALWGASAHKSSCQDVWLAVGPLSTPPTWGASHTLSELLRRIFP